MMCSCQHLGLVVSGNFSYHYDYLDTAVIGLSMQLDHRIFTAESAFKYSRFLEIIYFNISMKLENF